MLVWCDVIHSWRLLTAPSKDWKLENMTDMTRIADALDRACSHVAMCELTLLDASLGSIFDSLLDIFRERHSSKDISTHIREWRDTLQKVLPGISLAAHDPCALVCFGLESLVSHVSLLCPSRSSHACSDQFSINALRLQRIPKRTLVHFVELWCDDVSSVDHLSLKAFPGFRDAPLCPVCRPGYLRWSMPSLP